MVKLDCERLKGLGEETLRKDLLKMMIGKMFDGKFLFSFYMQIILSQSEP